jgi:hypothetical protein
MSARATVRGAGRRDELVTRLVRSHVRAWARDGADLGGDGLMLGVRQYTPRRMTGRWSWPLLGGGALGLGALIGAGALGWLGPLVICGADAAPLCIAWPWPLSAAVWLIFMATIAILTWQQARDWRDMSLARREMGLLAVLLLAALVVRLWRLDLALVGYDEAAAASLVAAWRHDGLFPLTGIVSSIGIPNPPAWPYLLAIVLLVVDSPWAVVLFGIGASMLSIFLTWWVGRRWVGPWAALAGAAFYAANFWSSQLGRGGWQPVFLQVPVILCLDALLILAIRRRPWALVVACGWLAVMVQLHFIAGVFALMLPLAAWPARRVLRPTHVVAGFLVGVLLLTPFLLFELHPMIRLRDVLALASDAGVSARIDLESWNLFWSVAGGRGAAGLGATGTEGLQQALGRWSSLSVLGIPLVALGSLAAIGGWPRGWRGVLLVAWMLTPVVGLARHTIGVIFHYLWLAIPGMALAVGALAEWASFRRAVAWRGLVWGGLGAYMAVSTATLVVVLQHVDQTGVYPALARPLGLHQAAANAARAARPAGAEILVGGTVWRSEILRFSLGYAVPSRIFDDCGPVPAATNAVYLLDDDTSPAAAALARADAPLLARVARPDGAFLVFGPPRQPLSEQQSGAQSLNCRDRGPQPRS